MADPRAVAVNVAANTNQPGFRGPVYPDGSFAYVPIPESAATLPRERFPVDEPPPTYSDLDLPFAVPADLRETPVHLDPELPRVHGRDRATYGDPHGVKAGRIAGLGPGDWLLFYATLSLRPHGWAGPDEGSRRGGIEDGDPATSGAFERVVPLSTPEAGADANRLVTALSSDSGKGPWWRRPMAFDADAAESLFERIEKA
ncbi:hypothetical protein [Halorubrum sp. CSM-61]|uniref:Nmad3 family putative nucleotide modification protein n=1 Tax=Halorubrum sp. CSM-61 TaxID=2485838 RepID=UPI000F4C9980|nr:hypothetical protein [Halorubrum sp. CSM-61]